MSDGLRAGIQSVLKSWDFRHLSFCIRHSLMGAMFLRDKTEVA